MQTGYTFSIRYLKDEASIETIMLKHKRNCPPNHFQTTVIAKHANLEENYTDI